MEAPRSGWYPDPWAGGYHRYWDGAAWTGDAFPNLPVGPERADVASQGAPALPRVTPPPPQWATAPAPTTQFPAQPPAPSGPPPLEPAKASWFSTGAGFIVLLVVMMLVVGSLAVVGAYYAFGGRTESPPAAARVVPSVPIRPTPTFPGRNPFAPFTPTTPVPPTDPSASVLAGLGLTQADVGPAAAVALEPGGDGLVVPTLDLCNGTFPSDSSRTARRQVMAFDDRGTSFLSTEAVLYANAGATAQGYSEMKAAAGACPTGPVASPIGNATVTTHFNPAPDGAWPAVATVDRLAFDFTVTTSSGATEHNVAVYLRRGRVLLGVYFYQPDGVQPAVAGQTTVPGIANAFAHRMEQLPASVVGG